MNITAHLKQFKIYLYVGLVWLFLWIMNSLISHSELFVPYAINEIWRFIFIVVTNFIFFAYALPFILIKRSHIFINVFIGSILVILHLILISIGLYFWRNLGIYLEIHTSLRQVTLQDGNNFDYFIHEVLYQSQGGVSSFIFFGIARLIYDNFKLKQTTQQLQIEKQEAELNYLKSQTNPHFLFNTLNNIYALARDKSDLTPVSILQLSKIMRFMLYETSGKFIQIEQEQKIISDYIALEKLRYDETLNVNFVYEIEDPIQRLPPLLLIPLVENAFKHGISESSNNSYINIHLSTTNKRLLFVVINSFEYALNETSTREQIGLVNLRRQLELLYSDYDLSIQQNDNEFSVTLSINFESYV